MYAGKWMLLLEKDKKSSLELLVKNWTAPWGLFELIKSHGIPHAYIFEISIPCLIAILTIDGMTLQCKD